ncbi:hypothetical protein GE21DRAFT_1080 [Neurospora crassa]|uniref:Glycoprotease family protein n=1 Tax=Neurospora crassa (strain ATCC 24698 / 74-OR23-1A / CBS 708.71 / DSM 1257 / FGSC 987) TaxID=367110 RepID=Q7SD86_NEUCR|nr:hypothetical protein NCU09307 [Neurospora crassa OR74A]EAA34713.1 hypothetical protein NCU09307 [Neurospora crassa OR74A]KHE78722.1 hypothetical protein GE21DRAFT_1080 [Neurospora crassa]|eukprot:XP_963949.1 hypothetical protein NCU09307 [Neurospora crassa OR74A]
MAVNVNDPMAHPGPSFHPTVDNRKEEWEDWFDDEPFTPIREEEENELPSLTPTFNSPYNTNNTNYTTKPSTQRTSFSTARHSMQRIRRVKSHQRQKAQNAKAGIRLITDMTKLRQHQSQQQLANHEALNKGKGLDGSGKFADAAALNALEGMASDESIGTFAWLRKKKSSSPASATPIERRMDRLAVDTPTVAELSPSVGGIMIGFAMPSDSNVVISPQTAVVATPVDLDRYFSPPPTAKQPISVWSPDTPDSQFTINSYRTAGPSAGTVPAVPAVPNKYRDTGATEFYFSDNEDELLTPMGYGKPSPPRVTTTAYFSDDDDDMATPVTLFEEDGSPLAVRQRSLTKAKSPVSATLTARSQQGWWDQITSPFTQSPVMSRTPVSSIQEEDDKQDWWKIGNNGSLSPNNNTLGQGSSGIAVEASRPPRIVIQDVSQVEASSSSYNPFATSSTATASSLPPAAAAMPTTVPMVSQPQSHAEKARILIEENESTPAELPPPYSPPKRNQNVRNAQNVENVRYRAVFPSNHPLNSMYPPSPGPVSPGLAQTMTSQGAIDLPYVPARPPPVRPAFHHGDFPNRPPGSFVPVTQRLKVEQKRRRNEKEEAVARKIGGMWRGRGCIPENGCFGRAGREGRKRRRWCLAVFVVTLVLIALAVALGVVLSRPKAGKPAPYSPWLNLTDYPPMPTGISTVIGTDSVTDTSCAQDPRFWSCALPRDQTAQAEPFAADQPSFIIQIQFDNSTQQAWNVTGQAIPTPIPTQDAEAAASPSQTGSNRSSVTNGTEASKTRGQRPQSGGEPMGFISVVKSLLRRQTQQAPSLGFIPRPSPPEFQDIYFLGNTTDGIVSQNKAGEPTPFYISILRTLDDSVGPNALARRDEDSDSASNQLNERQSKSGGVDLSFIPPVLNPDGTGAPAVLMPFPTQQPLRLFDRGLPTEHFGFYTYYNKSVYLTGDASSDRVGGSTAFDSKAIITWLSARYKVEIWTRQVNATRLLGSQSNGGAASNNSTRPGTFPYPITVTLDTHGGIPGKKFAFSRGVGAGGKILMNDTKFILNNMNQTGDWVNPGATFNPSFGGMDGGTGGCQCRYSNWVKLNAGDA